MTILKLAKDIPVAVRQNFSMTIERFPFTPEPLRVLQFARREKPAPCVVCGAYTLCRRKEREDDACHMLCDRNRQLENFNIRMDQLHGQLHSLVRQVGEEFAKATTITLSSTGLRGLFR